MFKTAGRIPLEYSLSPHFWWSLLIVWFCQMQNKSEDLTHPDSHCRNWAALLFQVLFQRSKQLISGYSNEGNGWPQVIPEDSGCFSSLHVKCTSHVSNTMLLLQEHIHPTPAQKHGCMWEFGVAASPSHLHQLNLTACISGWGERTDKGKTVHQSSIKEIHGCFPQTKRGYNP